VNGSSSFLGTRRSFMRRRKDREGRRKEKICARDGVGRRAAARRWLSTASTASIPSSTRCASTSTNYEGRAGGTQPCRASRSSARSNYGDDGDAGRNSSGPRTRNLPSTLFCDDDLIYPARLRPAEMGGGSRALTDNQGQSSVSTAILLETADPRLLRRERFRHVRRFSSTATTSTYQVARSPSATGLHNPL